MAKAKPYPTGGVQYDERGRPYILMSDGTKNYISPVAMGGQPPPDETGVFRSRPQWDQYKGEWETPIDWGNIVTMATGAGLGAGVLSAAGAFGGAGAGSAGSAGGAGGVGIGETGAVSGLAGSGFGGTLASTPIGAGSIPAIPALRGGAGKGDLTASGYGTAIDVLKRLAPAAGLVGLTQFTGRGGGNDIPPELREILNLQKNRMEMQNPLYESILRLAQSRLPTSAQGGVSDPVQEAMQRLAQRNG